MTSPAVAAIRAKSVVGIAAVGTTAVSNVARQTHRPIRTGIGIGRPTSTGNCMITPSVRSSTISQVRR